MQNSAAIPVACNDLASTLQGTWVDIDVLANDTVSFVPKRLYSLGPPAHGTAVTNNASGLVSITNPLPVGTPRLFYRSLRTQ